jgi:ribonuclease HI
MAIDKASGTIRLTFDGGSRGNPGEAYGSFRVVARGAARELETRQRLTFPRGTNNEAEYWTLIAALRWTIREARSRRLPLNLMRLHILGDSLLVIRQLQGEWKARDRRMRALRDEAAALLGEFGASDLQHRPRRKSVAEFGH